jgi:Family of unknown function (DUF6519)
MKGDFTRDTFDPTKHFSRVLMQQGRVMLDADWNEQSALLLHYLRAIVVDIIGLHAGPMRYCGFSLLQPKDLDAANTTLLTKQQVLPLKAGDFLIGSGRYYVEGVLCENQQLTSYLRQPDLPGAPVPEKGRTYLAYLDVWERHVSSVEDDDIREKALDGPDTASRAKVVWQLKLARRTPGNVELPTALDCHDASEMWHDWVELWQPTNRGHMRARVEPTEPSTDPCLIAPDSKYRGAENHLYRVEIHRGGAAWPAGEKNPAGTGATFKWSRDNGSVETTLVGVEGSELSVEHARGFAGDGWVELTNEARELNVAPGTQPGTLVEVIKLEGDALTIDPNHKSDTADLSAMTRVRRWDQRAIGDVELIGGAVPVEEKVWIVLEDGIEVYFDPTLMGPPATYRTGDYWLIPARVATGKIEWPDEQMKDTDGQVNPQALAPHGIAHHYAPVGVITFDGVAFNIKDCRCQFAPIHDCEPYPYGYGGEAIGLEEL